MSELQKSICPVCGFDGLASRIYVIKFIFCDCGLFHFGFDDHRFEPFMSARMEWFQAGMPYSAVLNPANVQWNVETILHQLNNFNLINVFDWPDYVRVENSTWTADYDVGQVHHFWALRRFERS